MSSTERINTEEEYDVYLDRYRLLKDAKPLSEQHKEKVLIAIMLNDYEERKVDQEHQDYLNYKTI